MQDHDKFAFRPHLDCRKWLRRRPEEMEASTREDGSMDQVDTGTGRQHCTHLREIWEGKFAKVGDRLDMGIEEEKC